MVSNNKRIAKNTLFLYTRMSISMLVSLFTSRVVLDVLGAEDYGIYNVVAGIVVMFTFLNTTMSGATSRFLTYELGKGDQNRLNKTFTTSLFIHLCIASAVAIGAEAIGIWLINNKLVIPLNRLAEANWAFQIAILTVCIKIIEVPFNAAILSHERMHIYAWIEIGKTCITLIGVYSLSVLAENRLVFYAIILASVQIGMLSMLMLYCYKRIPEISFKPNCDKTIIKPILSFCGWDLYGNLCHAARTQGINIILNIHFGAIANAAAGIATQIMGSTMAFGGNVIQAFRPQIIKSYASNERKTMMSLVINAIKYSLLLFSIIAIPIYIEMPYILSLWLKEVPEYTESLARVSLGLGTITIINTILNIPSHATGNIKWLSFIGGSIFLLTLPVAWLASKIFQTPTSVYLVALIMYCLNIFANSRIVKYQITLFNIKEFYIECILKTTIAIGIAAIIPFGMTHIISVSFIRLIIITILYIISLTIISYTFLIPKNISKKIICILKTKFLPSL